MGRRHRNWIMAHRTNTKASHTEQVLLSKTQSKQQEGEDQVSGFLAFRRLTTQILYEHIQTRERARLYLT